MILLVCHSGPRPCPVPQSAVDGVPIGTRYLLSGCPSALSVWAFCSSPVCVGGTLFSLACLMYLCVLHLTYRHFIPSGKMVSPPIPFHSIQSFLLWNSLFPFSPSGTLIRSLSTSLCLHLSCLSCFLTPSLSGLHYQWFFFRLSFILPGSVT